ncbi:MAG TPA: ATP-binding protein [Anaerolineales bacterium]|nr:ATP-binding protein [Anaerolineales bacterium]
MSRPPLYRSVIIISIASGFVASLGYLTWLDPPAVSLLPEALLFLVLVIVTTLLGVPLGGGTASLLPMAVIASYFVLGLIPAAWIALLGEIIAEALEAFATSGGAQPRPKNRLETVTRLAANATLQPASILVAGGLYQAVGGRQPFVAITPDLIIPLIILGLTYLLVDYLGAGLFFAGRGRDWLESFLTELPRMLTYEGLPLVFAPWVALVSGRMGTGALAILVVGLVAVAWTARSLAYARQRLERRVRELGVLQEVGRALGSNLNLEELLQAVYTQVASLMPAGYFYISLFDPALDEVSFPFVIEAGQRTTFPTRRSGTGLTELILRTGQPLLSRAPTSETRQMLGLSPAARPAASFLGVPLIVASRTVGVIALQSFDARNLYDEGHQNVLTSVAAAAAIAIQNARLFARLDQDLNLRLHQLDSVLKAARDGMLFLDCQGQVVMANRTAADYLGLAQLGVYGADGDPASEAQAQFLAGRLGYCPGELDQALADLLEGKVDIQRQTLSLPLLPDLAIERTLLPVRDQAGSVIGWLFVLHDRTQEVRLAALQDDLVEMLVHDLRSPLTIIQGGLEVIAQSASEDIHSPASLVLLPMQSSTRRMLHLVNEMLEIQRMENGELVVQPTRLPVRAFLEDCASPYTAQLVEAGISLAIDISPDLPDLLVDTAHTERLLHNLLDNAIKFTPDHGRISMAARLDSIQHDRAVLITLQDTGSGIPAADQQSLFQKYRQIEGSSGRRHGSGLGLYYCRLVAEAHGGKIWVESLPERGTCFHILLPAAQP